MFSSSKFAIILIGLFYLLVHHTYNWQQKSIVGGGDSWGYYVYLPSIFIYQDLKSLDWVLEKRKELKPGSVGTKDGRLNIQEAHDYQESRVIKYTYGIAFLNVTPFILAHLYCLIHPDYPADGFSTPYIYLLFIYSLLFILFGLWILRKTLLVYFDERVVAWTLLALGLGTNLYYFGVLNSFMAHPFLFTLWCLLVFATQRFYENPRSMGAFMIGILVGLITIIRPVDGLCILIPVLWGITHFSDLKKRIQFFYKNKTLIWSLFTGGILLLLPQMIYWYTLTGNLFFFSYQGEGFDFVNPKIKQGLFGFNNGWLIYTPVMAFSVIGLLFLRRKSRSIFLPTVLIFLLFIYAIYSWWNYYYINGFGSRPMVDIYGLLAFPFAAFTALVISKRSVWNWNYFGLIGIFILLNLFQTHQHHLGVLWTENGSQGYYTQVFGKTSIDLQSSVAFDLGQIQYKNLEIIDTIWYENFEKSTNDQIITGNSAFGEKAYVIDQSTPGDSAFFQIPFEELNLQKGEYIGFYAQLFSPRGTPGIWDNAVVRFSFESSAGILAWKHLRLHNKPDSDGNYSLFGADLKTWSPVQANLTPPRSFQEGDVLKVFLLPGGNRPIYIDEAVLVKVVKG